MMDPQHVSELRPALSTPDFRTVFYLVPGALLLLLPDDPVFTIVAVNDAYVEVSGVPRKDLVGRGVFEVFPDDRSNSDANGAHNLHASFLRVIATLAADRMPVQRYSVERPAEEGGGFEERYWNALNKPVPGADGRVEYILHSVEEVTHSIRAEQHARATKDSLGKSEERLSFALAACGGVGTWDWDIPGDRVYCDERFAQLFSMEPKRGALGAPIADFIEGIHPDDRAEVSERIQQALETQREYAAEYRLLRRDGSVRWVYARGCCHNDGNGKPTRFPGVVFDITDRKTAEIVLRQQWNTFDTALSNTPDFTYIFDLEGRFLYVNRALLSLLQKRFDEAIGKNFFDLGYPPELAGRLQAQIQQVIDTKEPLRDRTPFTDPTGETRHYEYIFVPVLAANGRVESVAGSTRDITEQRQTEDALRKGEEQLRRKNSELEEFAYVASHDLQEPLRMVNIYTQLLIRRFAEDQPEAREYAGHVRQGVLRMESLINDLLSFSQTIHEEELPADEGNLSDALAGALAVLKNRIEESGAAIVAPPALPTVRGDTSQLVHVFQNLLSNALKYRKKEVPPEIIVSAERAGERWIVSVRDNGIGFEPQYAERIFGLFRRLHKGEYPGTGLGLAICKRIVERFGGRMWAEGHPGKGATFFFSLPGTESPVPSSGNPLR